MHTRLFYALALSRFLFFFFFFLVLRELALVHFLALIKFKKTVTLVALRMGFVEAFLAFSASRLCFSGSVRVIFGRAESCTAEL